MNYTVFVDVETGGTEPRHPTIQLAAIAVDQNGDEVESFFQNIAFNEADCDPEALKMNHYEAAAWKDAVAPLVCAARFSHWLRPYQSVTRTSRQGKPYTVARLAGYNAVRFDEPRLREMFSDMFCPWEYLVRDVLQMALFYFDEHQNGQPENMKLLTVAAWFDVPTDNAHDALADARMCAAVARAIREAW